MHLALANSLPARALTVDLCTKGWKFYLGNNDAAKKTCFNKMH